MGERGILGITHYSGVNSLIMSLGGGRGLTKGSQTLEIASVASGNLAMTFPRFFLALCMLATTISILSSCTPIPRIIVLHDPLTVEEHLSLGLSYELKGEYDFAILEYSKAFRKDKKDYRPLFYTGNVHYKKKGYREAERFYKKALRIAPDNGDIHNNLAWVFIDTAKLEKAKEEINKALVIKRDPFYLDTLANIYAKMDNYAGAVEVLKEAVGITQPADTDLLYSEYKLLGELYETLGMDDAAREAREKAAEYREK